MDCIFNKTIPKSTPNKIIVRPDGIIYKSIIRL